MNTTINERMKLVREFLKLTQVNFAENLGVSRTHISNMENGNDNPSLPLLKLISLKYSINENWLLNGEGEITENIENGSKLSKVAYISDEIKQLLNHRAGKELDFTVATLSNICDVLEGKNLNCEEKKQYLSYINKSMNDLAQVIFNVSYIPNTITSNNDVTYINQLTNHCNESINTHVKNVKKAASVYLNKNKIIISEWNE